MAISSASREFFAALAGAGATLTGLLFVAMSVAPRERADGGPAVIRQVRASAALLAFVNSLAVSLFGLDPGIGLRWPAAILGVTGILFIAAGTRSILSSSATTTQRLGQLGLLNLLVLIFGTELIAGIVLIVDSHIETAVNIIGAALVGSLLVGIARAWELIGDRGTGIFTSIGLLAQKAPNPPDESD
ncbi:MAG TPA: hypothetical protein VN969_27675 [Streptosporangiaceae bacterium]|jgi:hypothetical protein|nr:hypothetical protein [Streptosporangiaceae bacterium]